ncbi:semaphorin-5B-like isoform X3 [Bolinopsis microptera]|uniref:semaphorin-5B-like isoform X3 n=2 Tax=Bolinopsis microptera TaxID=2820187 RepID=UPI0030796C95
MNRLLLLLIFDLVSGQQYSKHITPIDYEVPHELIFKEQCWSTEEGDLIVPQYCSNTTNYCSKCYFNKDVQDYRNHYMSYNDNRLIVGAMDNIFAFDVTDNLFEKLQQVDARHPCVESCKNYNRLLLPLPDTGQILTCGTNAYACQIREIKNLTKFKRLSGEGFVPINENAQNTAAFSDSRIFAGSMMSGDAADNAFVVASAKIGREGEKASFVNIVATSPSIEVLNRAKFVASFSSGDYAYFLFQEIEFSTGDRVNKVVSRIARVCKEDTGVAADLEYFDNAKLWQTFVKSRIYCENKVTDPTFGEQTFTYNRVGAGIIDDNRILYAAFSEGDTSASGSVVCRFNLTEIDINFNTAKYNHFNTVGSSRPKAKSRTPPTCEDIGNAESEDIYELMLTVDDVTSKDPPLFLQSGPQFTKLLVDSNIRNVSNPVLFIGTNMGKVLKVTWRTADDGSFKPILIESMQVAKGDTKSDLSVNFLAFEKTIDPNYLFVGTGTSVSKVVISRCLRFPNLTQNCCYASLDPYCGWCSVMRKCTSRPDCSSDWIQSLTATAPDESTCERRDPTPVPKPTTKPDSHETDRPKTEPEPTELVPKTLKPPTTKQPPPDKSTDITREPVTATRESVTNNNSTAADPDGRNGNEDAVTSETAGWKKIAIVMATLCGIFVLISALLALNLARKWCYASRKPPQKMGNNNLQHNYNPLASQGPKSEDFSDRIPVYNTRTNNV